jgi:hypothetical protein
MKTRSPSGRVSFEATDNSAEDREMVDVAAFHERLMHGGSESLTGLTDLCNCAQNRIAERAGGLGGV